MMSNFLIDLKEILCDRDRYLAMLELIDSHLRY